MQASSWGVVLVSLGQAERQGDLFDDVNRFCEQMLPESSLFAVLHRERDRLFPDVMFADLFSVRGRRSVPPSVVATVMVLQRLEGLSDREAVERYCFDNRWRYACGVGGYDGDGWVSFSHTVLVDMRARLRASADPRRLFRVVLGAASAAGLVGARRVLDSTPLYDAVATMDTITLIRSAIRALLKAADPALESELRVVLTSGDDYASAGKPQIDWEDPAGREALIDSRARDGYACLAVLDGRELDPVVAEAGELLATVLGQDLEQVPVEGDSAPVFRIARRVAKDRVISTVDPQARHGHKTAARGFDGYKGHVAIDPDSELITDTVVSAGNVGDAAVAADLVKDLAADRPRDAGEATEDGLGQEPEQGARHGQGPVVYGDAAYGSSGQFLNHLAGAGIDSRCKTQPPTAAGGMFPKDRFDIDLPAGTVTCPNNVTVTIHRDKHGDGTAYFGPACADCPLRSQCTTAAGGRTISVGRHEQRLAQARAVQQDPAWRQDYRATRPKVERRLGQLMRRKHGGRRARMRGRNKVDADFNLLAAAHNVARLAVLGIRSTTHGWVTATA